MNISILSVTAGYGHHAVARALEREFARGGDTCAVTDVYRETNRLLYGAVDKGYQIAARFTPQLYRIVYNNRESHRISDGYRRDISGVINLVCSLIFETQVKRPPDAVVCTHVFAAQIINELKKRGKFAGVPCVGVVTDFTMHPYWEEVTHVERVILPHELLALRAEKKRVSPSRISPTGIPVDEKFSVEIPREEAARRLGIDPFRRTGLLMAGSMGYGVIADLAAEIAAAAPKTQLLVVCGRNKRALKVLTASDLPNVRAFGFTEDVDVLMSAADFAVTKPGGLTVSEALVKRLPLILTTPIPGQEERNAEFLLNNGAALAVTKTFPIDEALYALTDDRLKLLRESAALLRKPHAARDAANLVRGLAGG